MFDPDSTNDEIVEFLKEAGAIESYGVDKNGEQLFKFNLPILKEVMPEMYEEISEEIDNDLLELYQKGLVSVEYDENLHAKFSITEKGRTVLNDKDLFPFL